MRVTGLPANVTEETVARRSGNLMFFTLQEERFGAPRVVGPEKPWWCPLAADALSVPHFHYCILQPLERREDLGEGTQRLPTSPVDYSDLASNCPDLSTSTLPGGVGDRHVALHCAFHPVDSRRHSSGSLERRGVLPEAPVEQASGDQCRWLDMLNNKTLIFGNFGTHL